ncbi:MAG: hypothetical protein LBN38_08355 [Verrucomicrobiota bacterium]|jgi:hypothetical protein|nr:hypothetical protein [Verrucomicrobiota bacterium]
MTDLFNNSVTIIATFLAGFFILMALVRRHISRRASNAAKAPKPYTVSDPYVTPASLPPPPATLNTAAALKGSTQANNKFFRQFGDEESAHTRTAANEYIWE